MNATFGIFLLIFIALVVVGAVARAVVVYRREQRRGSNALTSAMLQLQAAQLKARRQAEAQRQAEAKAKPAARENGSSPGE